MKRLTLALLAILLTWSVTAAPTLPSAKEAPRDATTYENDLGARPGSTCLKLALKEHRLVLTDPDNRADHHYLAEAYEAFAAVPLEC